MYVLSEEELWEYHSGICIRSSKMGKVIHFACLLLGHSGFLICPVLSVEIESR